jgi:hypothetical protein
VVRLFLDAMEACGPARLPHAPCNLVEIMPRLDEHLRWPKANGASA